MTRDTWVVPGVALFLIVGCRASPGSEHTSPAAGGAADGAAAGAPDSAGGAPAVRATSRHGGTSPQAPDFWAECDHVPVVEKCRDGWCEIPSGCVVVGSPETEGPRRAAIQEDQALVTLSRPFIILQTEVTQGEWEAKGFANP